MRCLLVLIALAAAAAGDELAFVDVHVVPMDRGERVLEEATVLVRDGTIVAVGAAHLPAGVRTVDGKGKYLMPGLCDMHVHVWYEEEHVLFLAKGVTTVRNLWGQKKHVRWARDRDRVGPNLYTSGPLVDGRPPIWEDSRVVETPDEARAAVASMRKAGYGAVKVYNRLKPDVYRALVAAARAHGLRVEGHVPHAVGIHGVLDAKQDSIEHLEGYFGFGPTDPGRLVARTVEAGTWNCPTQVVYQMFVPADRRDAMLAQPHMRFVPPRLRATWDPARDFRLKDLEPKHFARLGPWMKRRAKLIKRLHDAGANLMLGTDAGNPFVVAGWAVHTELRNMVDAGLSPYEALALATREPGRYLKEDFGTVAVGQRADLLLLEANPLADVANAEKIAGVMVRGRWYPRADLDRRLDEVAASYGRPRERFEGLDPLPAGGKEYRFAVKWNGLVVGEERFVLRTREDGTTTVVGQEVNDPPYDSVRTYALAFDTKGRVVEVDGAARDPETAWLVPTLGGWIALLRGRADGPVAVHELDDDGRATEIPTLIARADGRVRVTMDRRDGRFVTEFELDAEGVPLSMTTVLQQGTVEKVRAGG